MRLNNSINIILGYACNYRCKHCITSSGPDQKNSRVSDEEIQTLCQTIRDHQPRVLLFTGGEPTLFPEIINTIVKAHPTRETAKIMITTNGWYGKSESDIEKTLCQINELNAVQMSFDIFHGNESKISYVKNIADYCRKQNIEFTVTMCLSNPMDLVKAKPILKDLNVPVTFQPVITAGRAVQNELQFRYFSFEEEALEKRCPSGSAVYIPQKGFSNCCSSLVYGEKPFKGAIHSTLNEHANSSFYKDISSLTMRELAEKKNVDITNLPPNLSHVCHLCEYIHSKAGT